MLLNREIFHSVCLHILFNEVIDRAFVLSVSLKNWGFHIFYKALFRRRISFGKMTESIGKLNPKKSTITQTKKLRGVEKVNWSNHNLKIYKIVNCLIAGALNVRFGGVRRKCLIVFFFFSTEKKPR